jgi:hypothetical protein
MLVRLVVLIIDVYAVEGAHRNRHDPMTPPWPTGITLIDLFGRG